MATRFKTIGDDFYAAVFVMNGEKFVRVQAEADRLAETPATDMYPQVAKALGLPEDGSHPFSGIVKFPEGGEMFQFFLGKTDEPDSNI